MSIGRYDIYMIYIYMFDVCGYGVIMGYMAYMSVISYPLSRQASWLAKESSATGCLGREERVYEWSASKDMGVEPKIGFFSPQITPFVHRVFHEIFTIHFGFFSLFLGWHPYDVGQLKLNMFVRKDSHRSWDRFIFLFEYLIVGTFHLIVFCYLKMFSDIYIGFSQLPRVLHRVVMLCPSTISNQDHSLHHSDHPEILWVASAIEGYSNAVKIGNPTPERLVITCFHRKNI